MNDYQVHPGTYDIEIRDGQSVDDYIATARGFNSTAEFREYYRGASPERRKEMRRARDNTSADDGDDIRRRTLDLLKAGQ